MSQNGNVISIRKNGPLICSGEITILSAEGDILLQDNEAWLCRCGQSKKMPFCDGSHKQAGFSHDSPIEDVRAETLEGESGALTITVKANAMLSFKGPVTIQTEGGESSSQRTRGALCRCGASQNKPFCDASHKRIGFKVD